MNIFLLLIVEYIYIFQSMEQIVACSISGSMQPSNLSKKREITTIEVPAKNLRAGSHFLSSNTSAGLSYKTCNFKINIKKLLFQVGCFRPFQNVTLLIVQQQIY